jgi:hypothetical protein
VFLCCYSVVLCAGGCAAVMKGVSLLESLVACRELECFEHCACFLAALYKTQPFHLFHVLQHNHDVLSP